MTMDAPKSVVANYNLLSTFTSAGAEQLVITGTGCAAGTYTTPITLAWGPGANCSVSFNGTQTSGDVRSSFSKWSDGPTSNPRTFTASAGASYTIEWNTEYRLTRIVTPLNGGSISGADGFYAASSTVQLTATPTSGYQFGTWSGDASGSTNPLPVVMNGPKTITANFSVPTAAIFINSNVSSLQFTVSGTGCNPGSYSAPASFNWPEGTVCAISTPATQGGDVRSVFEGWADGPTANPRTITAIPSSATYEMRFGTQYKLTRLTTGQGSVSGADGYYAAGSSVQLTATPAGGYQFTGWSGNVVSSANPLSLTMNAPSTITANFSANPASVAINANVTGAQFAVSGTGCPAGTYTAPVSVVWTSGTACSITPTTPMGGPDTRYVFSSWTDGSSATPRSIVAAPGASYTMSFTTEHKLTRSVSGQGTVSGSDGFYGAGSIVQLTASAGSGYQFTGWSGSASGASNPLALVMDGPKSVTANFSASATAVTINSNTALPFTVSGAGCPVGTYTAPVALAWTTGTNCTISPSSPQGGPDSRWVFSRWADGSTANPRTVAASSGAVYSMVWSVEHRLTRTVSARVASVDRTDTTLPAQWSH